MIQKFDYEAWLAEHGLVDLAKHGHHNQASHGNRYGADGKRVRTAAGQRRRAEGIEAAKVKARAAMDAIESGMKGGRARTTTSAGGFEMKDRTDETGDLMFSTSGYLPMTETKPDRYVSGSASKGPDGPWRWEVWNHDEGETVEGTATSRAEASTRLDAALRLWGAKPGKPPRRSYSTSGTWV